MAEDRANVDGSTGNALASSHGAYALSHRSNSFKGGSQNYGPFLGTLNLRGRIIIGIQKRDHNFDNHPKGPSMAKILCNLGPKHLCSNLFGAKLSST